MRTRYQNRKTFLCIAVAAALVTGLLFSHGEGITLTPFPDESRTFDVDANSEMASVDSSYSTSLAASSGRLFHCKKSESRRNHQPSDLSASLLALFEQRHSNVIGEERFLDWSTSCNPLTHLSQTDFGRAPPEFLQS